LLAFEDVTHRRAIEREVEELLREKEMLLQEMQHRVANASILLMKAKTVQPEEARLQLESPHQRVLSIAAVQQHLHMEGGGKPIDIGAHLEKLGKNIGSVDDRRLSLNVIADPGSVMWREAASVGLVVTEPVMNALNHAFPEPKADAAILVRYNVAGTDWQLAISDNGVRRPDVSASASKPGLGTSLIMALTRQLAAVLDTDTGPHGTAVSITHATFKSKASHPNESRVVR
jgi:chemotaxis protein methyltransferase CheR